MENLPVPCPLLHFVNPNRMILPFNPRQSLLYCLRQQHGDIYSSCNSIKYLGSITGAGNKCHNKGFCDRFNITFNIIFLTGFNELFILSNALVKQSSRLQSFFLLNYSYYKHVTSYCRWWASNLSLLSNYIYKSGHEIM